MNNTRRKVSQQNKNANVTKNKDENLFKNILIIVLLIVSFVQAIYIVFYTLNLKENTVKKSFLSSFIDIQKEVCEYLVEEKANTYDAYNYSQILTGIIVNEEGNINKIKDIDGKDLTPIVNSDNKLDINGVEYYTINNDNIKSSININMPSYKNMTWYISNEGDVKVKLEKEPNWWTSDLDCLLIGN